MIEPWRFVLVTLAVYRLTCLIVAEDGPFDVFARIRGRIDPEQKTWVGRGIRCSLCVSFWLSLLALALGGSWLEWLAVAGAAHMLIRIGQG